MKDYAEKLPTDIKEKLEKSIKETKDCKDGEDVEKLKNAVENLKNQAMEIGKYVYNAGGSSSSTGGNNSSSSSSSTDGAPEGAKEAN